MIGQKIKIDGKYFYKLEGKIGEYKNLECANLVKEVLEEDFYVEIIIDNAEYHLYTRRKKELNM